MSGYNDLYYRCQELTPKVSSRTIREYIKDITGKVADEQWSDMKGHARGLFIQHQRNNVIVIERELNDCWRRFVLIKEFMHFFDKEYEFVADPEKFENLLTDLSTPPDDPSVAVQSEYRGVWMALALFCPEDVRQDLNEKMKANLIDAYGVATKLKIPEDHIPKLFSNRYEQELTKILGHAPGMKP